MLLYDILNKVIYFSMGEDQSQSYFFRDCHEMHIKIWECPSFLFLILGILNISSTIGAYFIATSYQIEPEIVALISVVVAVAFLIISYVIVQAFSRAAEANRIKSEFVGIASHQLRTPLTNIKFALEYLSSPRHGDLNFNEKQFSQFTIIKESNERLLKLVSNLLDLSRIEQGRIVLEQVPLDLKNITESLLQELQPFIQVKKLNVHFEVKEPIAMVAGDNSRVRMVVQNIMDNAIKYNRDGGDLWIKMETQRKRTFLSIADTGLGIPKSEQRRVFQKFYRSTNVTLNHSYGSGLGLHIAKVIITELKGEMGFSSQEGKGSTFWFTLPIWEEKP